MLVFSLISLLLSFLQLDTWVAQHEEDEARAEQAQQAAMAEDGWTVVVRSKVRRIRATHALIFT